MLITKLLEPLTRTLFPPLCNVCGKKLDDFQEYVCDECMAKLPLTNNWHIPHNLIYDRLKEESEVVGAATLFHYKSDDPYSNLILNAKFRNQRALAREMGRLMGRYIRGSEVVKGVDAIVALPLHASRRRWRGYNQSDLIAEGLSEVLGIAVLKEVVMRHKKSAVQSRMKGERLRRENVKGVFRVTDREQLAGKRIFLVDDVITTGSTMASCAHTIKISVRDVEIIAIALSSTQ